MTRIRIYKARVTTPYGRFIVAVKSDGEDAARDIRTAAASELRCALATIKVGDVFTDSTMCDFFPIKNAVSNGEQWAWMAR